MAVAPLLARIQGAFDVTASTAGWTLSAFSLAAVIATLVGARSGDEVGHARVLTVSLTVFVVGALICASAVNASLLIAGRAVMGCGGAIFPLALTVAAKCLPHGRRSSGIALVSGTLGLGSTVGAPAGGVFADLAGIPAVFIGCALLGAAALIAVVKAVGFEPRNDPFHFDSAGITVYGTGITCLLVALSSVGDGGFSQPLTLCTFAVGIALLLALGWVESRVAFPALSFELLTDKPIALANITSALLSAGISGMLALLPMAAQDAHFGGQTPLSAGQSGAPYHSGARCFLACRSWVHLFKVLHHTGVPDERLRPCHHGPRGQHVVGCCRRRRSCWIGERLRFYSNTNCPRERCTKKPSRPSKLPDVYTSDVGGSLRYTNRNADGLGYGLTSPVFCGSQSLPASVFAPCGQLFCGFSCGPETPRWTQHPSGLRSPRHH